MAWLGISIWRRQYCTTINQTDVKRFLTVGNDVPCIEQFILVINDQSMEMVMNDSRPKEANWNPSGSFSNYYLATSMMVQRRGDLFHRWSDGAVVFHYKLDLDLMNNSTATSNWAKTQTSRAVWPSFTSDQHWCSYKAASSVICKWGR